MCRSADTSAKAGATKLRFCFCRKDETRQNVTLKTPLVTVFGAPPIVDAMTKPNVPVAPADVNVAMVTDPLPIV